MNDDEPMFSTKVEKGFLLQVCRESLIASGQSEELPNQKANVLTRLLEEPEAYLLNTNTEQEDENSSNVIKKDFTEARKINHDEIG